MHMVLLIILLYYIVLSHIAYSYSAIGRFITYHKYVYNTVIPRFIHWLTKPLISLRSIPFSLVVYATFKKCGYCRKLKGSRLHTFMFPFIFIFRPDWSWWLPTCCVIIKTELRQTRIIQSLPSILSWSMIYRKSCTKTNTSYTYESVTADVISFILTVLCYCEHLHIWDES